MSRTKKHNRWLPAVAFIYLALVGGMVLLSAAKALAV